MLVVVAAMSAHAQTKVRAQYIEETELVSIVSHLAGVSGYNWDAEEVGVDDYLAEVDSIFAPYKQHPLIPFIREQLAPRGFQWHFPMHVALRLHVGEGKIGYDDTFVPDFDAYYEYITREHEQQFLVLLNDFYTVSHFHAFFTAHRPLYAACEAAMQHVLDQVDFDWYDTFFGPRERSTFSVYLGLLIGPANYAVHQQGKEGTEHINAVMGCCDRDREGTICYDTYSTLPIVIHECNHSYCNPLNEAFWPQLKEKAEAFFALNARHYTDEAYGSAQFVLNETFVEACVIRYLMKHPFDFSENTDKWMEALGLSEDQMPEGTDRLALIQDAYLRLLIDIDEQEKRFYMIRSVIHALEEREQYPARYPTMYDFMPRYVEVVNAYK